MSEARSLALGRLSLLLLLAAPPAAAQAEVLWRVPGDVVQFAIDVPRSTFVDGQGGAVLFEFGNSTSTEMRLRSIDANGNERWLRTTPIAGLGQRLSVTSDGAGNLVTALNDSATIQHTVEGLGVDGNVRWTRTVSAPPPTPSALRGPGLAVEHPSGEVTFAASFGELDFVTFITRSSTTLIRLDAAGAERWRTTIPDHRVQRMDVDGDELIVSLRRSDGVVDQYPVQVMRLDSGGSTLWSRLFSSGAIQASVFANEVLTDPSTGNVLVQWTTETAGFSLESTGITAIDPAGDVEWTWAPSGLSGLDRSAGGMMFGAPGELLVGAVGSDTSNRTTKVEVLDRATGSVLRDAEFVDFSLAAPGGLQPLPGGGAMVTLYDWGPGPSVVTLDAGLNVVSSIDLQPPPVNATSPRTRLGTATPDGAGGLILTGWDSYSGGPQPGAHLFRMRVAAGSDIGTAYCAPSAPNSTGATSTLGAFGAAAAGENNLTLVASALPPFAASLFLVSDQTDFVPNAGGSEGTLCLGGAIGRYTAPGQVQFANAEGAATLRLDLDRTPGPSALFSILPGTIWRFQLWHRDTNPGQTSNLSNGVQVRFF